MIIADLTGDLARHQPARCLEIHHVDHRLEQRCMDPASDTCRFTLEQRDEDRLDEEPASGEIDDRDADPDRSLAGKAGDRHEAAHALQDLVDAGAVSIGTCLAEARDAGINDARIDRLQAFVVYAKPMLHPRPHVLDDDVGALHQLFEDREALRRLEIERQRFLVALQIEPVRAEATAENILVLLRSHGRLDTDDLGAPVCEMAAGSRARTGDGEFNHREARERKGRVLVFHAPLTQRPVNSGERFSRKASRPIL